MIQTVELIYDLDCPNIKAARTQLMRAFAQLNINASWKEWDLHSKDCPAHAKQYGSPTILVNMKDVAGISPQQHGDCCRLYCDADGLLRGAPPVKAIIQSLLAATDTSSTTQKRVSNWKSSLVAIPGIAFAFLPTVSCPLCWPAYAAVLSSVGLGFLLEKQYLFSTTVAFLLLVLGTLAFGARNRRGYRPFLVGSIGAIVILIGKFLILSSATMYAGIGLLVSTTIWNVWPRKKDKGCPACLTNSSKLTKTKRNNSHE